MRALLFWSVFVPVAVWAQLLAPGLDVLACGLIVCLQRHRPLASAWLGLVIVLIQEGGGSLPFGTTILLYGALMLGYAAGTGIFESRNFLFMALLGLFFGAARFSVMQIMGSLADAGIDQGWLTQVCVRQAVAFPLVWAVVDALYSRLVKKYVATV